MIRHAGRTDPGRRRDNNEDALLLDVDNGVFAVADGVGGREAGEVASAIAIETLRAAAPGLARAVATYAAAPEWSGRNSILEALDASLQLASQRIYEEAEAAGKQGGQKHHVGPERRTGSRADDREGKDIARAERGCPEEGGDGDGHAGEEHGFGTEALGGT